MIHIFRKNQRVLMLLISALTIVAFIFLYNTRQLDDLSNVRNPVIYGKALTQVAIDRHVKNYQLTMSLGQYDLLRKLGGMAQEREAALSEFVWNLIVLQHQSRELGIEPTDDQVADRIKNLPLFKSENQFDPRKYSTFVSEQLTPRGFTERQLEEVMRDAIRLESLSEIVEAPAAMSEEELKATMRIFQPVTAEVIKFNKDAKSDSVPVAPEEIASIFENNKAALNTTETRAINYVAFELPEASKLEGKEKTEALQKLANAASVVTDTIAQGSVSLETAAKNAGLKITKLAAFDRSGSQPKNGDPKSTLIAQSLAPAAFLLAGPGKSSDVVQAGDAFYIFEITEVNPARPLTLDEAKPEIEARLRSQKSDQLFMQSTTAALNSIRSALQAGKPLNEAATSPGVTIENLTAVVPAAKDATSEQQLITANTLLLKDGEISNLAQAPWGAFAVRLTARGPADSKAFGDRESEIRTNMIRNKRDLLFAEWLRTSREAANITMPGNTQG
jgi:hypothetical protein